MSKWKDLLGDEDFTFTHARADDPGTSKKAAARTAPRVGSQKARALSVWQRTGRDLTSDEASAIDGFPDDRYHQRVSDLIWEGFLVPTGAERDSRRGSAQRVLRLWRVFQGS